MSKKKKIKQRIRFLFEVEKTKNLNDAFKIVKKRKYIHDPEFHQAFLSRKDLEKKIAIKACRFFKDQGSWIFLFKKTNINLSVAEKLFWSIKAEKYNNFACLKKSRIPFFKRTILDVFLETEEFKNFLKNADSLQIFLLGIKLNNKKVFEAFSKKETTEEEDFVLIIPKIVLFIIGFLPLRFIGPLEYYLRLHCVKNSQHVKM